MHHMVDEFNLKAVVQYKEREKLFSISGCSFDETFCYKSLLSNIFNRIGHFMKQTCIIHGLQLQLEPCTWDGSFDKTISCISHVFEKQNPLKNKMEINQTADDADDKSYR